MSSIPENPYYVIGVVVVLAGGFVLPTMIALVRQVERIWVVVIFNMIGVGWPAAMICAITFPRRQATTLFADDPSSHGVPMPYYGTGRKLPPRAN